MIKNFKEESPILRKTIPQRRFIEDEDESAACSDEDEEAAILRSIEKLRRKISHKKDLSRKRF